MAKEDNFSTYLMITSISLNLLMPKEVLGSNYLDTQTHCVHALQEQSITNHAPIGEYRLRFFPNEEFKCPYGVYPIKLRRHILHECRRFNRYRNSRQDSLSHFVMFLKANPNAFAFIDSFTSTVISRSYN